MNIKKEVSTCILELIKKIEANLGESHHGKS